MCGRSPQFPAPQGAFPDRSDPVPGGDLKRLIVGVFGVLLLAAAGPAQAQGPFLFLGGGATIPTSLYKSDDGAKTNLYGAAGFQAYRFGPAAKTGFYVLGSGGGMKHDFRSTSIPADNGGNFEFAWRVGTGVEIPAGKQASVYVETGYFQRGDTRFIPIFAGVEINLGKGN